MQTQRPQVGEAIRSGGKMEKDTIDALVAGVNDYKQTFLAQQKDAAAAKAAADTAAASTAAKSQAAAAPATEKSNAAGKSGTAGKSDTDASTPGNPAA
jgi:DNA replication initiation complex subunit (GINS family)